MNREVNVTRPASKETLEAEIVEGVKLRLRFDDSGEFQKALLQLLKDK